MDLVIMLLGTAYTPNFFKSWTKLISFLSAKTSEDVKVRFHNYYSPVVYEGRNHMLLEGADPLTTAVPLNGLYDQIIWLETDMVFEPEDIWKLVEADGDIVTGIYPMGVGNPETAVAGTVDKGRISIPKIKKLGRVDLLPIDYCGLGIVKIRKGVYEAIGYPWYNKLYQENDGIVSFLGDDFSFCMEAKAKGKTVYAHPQVFAGHEKQVVVR